MSSALLSSIIQEVHVQPCWFLHLAGSGGLLPIVLCGDFNCTPNSPLVDFITSSFLNYSKMCATEVAGYNHRKSRSREIPSPLLPPSMNIGPNCIYMETMETDSTTTTAINSTPTATANGMAEVAGGNDMLCKKEKRPHSSSSSSHGSSHQKEERDGQHEKAVASTKMVGTSDAGDFVQSQNEGFKAASSSDGLSSKRYSKTRSARGAKARGMSYSGIKMSNFPSLTSGPKSTVKTSQSPSDGQPSSSSSGPRMADDKKPLDSSVDIEGDASTDDSDMDWERISTGDENQKSDTTALNSSTEAKPEPRSNSNSTGGRAVDLHTGQLSRSEPKKRSLCHIQGLITHPFKFITAYPQSRISTPSTVTTFHQSAFETVDYIFFTPPTKKRVGFHLLSRKALPSTHVLLDLGPQPHRYLSSDHLLLQACFQLVSRKTLRTN